MTDPTAAPANTTPTRHRAALALVVGLVLTCSGGPDGDSSATATTATAATTTATTTTTSTTVLVLTTLEPLGAEEAAVAEAAAAALTASEEALADPDAPGVQERLDALYAEGGQSREVVEANLQFLRDTGYRVRQNPQNPRRFTVEEVVLFDDESPSGAEVTVCVLDTAITYEPGGAPDGSDAIVNDDFGAVRGRYTLVVEDDTWQLFESQGITELQRGVVECPAA